MRTVIQRVSHAAVSVAGETTGSIGQGLLILLGIEPSDSQEDADWLVKKIAALRIFDDAEGVMNLSLHDVGGEALVVSQFTLMASYKKGNRPPTSAPRATRWPCRSTSTSAARSATCWAAPCRRAASAPTCRSSC